MSNVTVHRCDQCGKTIPNRNEVQGWIRLQGTIFRQVGIYKNGSWQSDYLNGDYDYCALTCLILRLNEIRQKDNPQVPPDPPPPQTLWERLEAEPEAEPVAEAKPQFDPKHDGK